MQVIVFTVIIKSYQSVFVLAKVYLCSLQRNLYLNYWVCAKLIVKNDVDPNIVKRSILYHIIMKEPLWIQGADRGQYPFRTSLEEWICRDSKKKTYVKIYFLHKKISTCIKIINRSKTKN